MPKKNTHRGPITLFLLRLLGYLKQRWFSTVIGYQGRSIVTLSGTPPFCGGDLLECHKAANEAIFECDFSPAAAPDLSADARFLTRSRPDTPPLVRKIVERLQNQHSKRHNRIERLPAGATLPHLLRVSTTASMSARNVYHGTVDRLLRADRPSQTVPPTACPHRKNPTAPSPPQILPSWSRVAQRDRRDHFFEVPFEARLAAIVPSGNWRGL